MWNGKRFLLTIAVVALVPAVFWSLHAFGSGSSRPRRAEVNEPRRLGTSAKVERQMEFTTFLPADSEYQLQVTFIGEHLTFSTPWVIVRDGERVTVKDAHTEEYVAGERTENGFIVPLTRGLEEGSRFDILVCEVDGDQVVVDISASFSSISGDIDDNELRLNTENGRFIKRAKCGELISVNFGDWQLQTTIERSGDRAAAAP